MRALVISGGGSKGAFAGGVAEHLIKDLGRHYDLFVGSSTGSLLSVLLAPGDLEKAKHVYTTISAKDIFTLNPYKVRKWRGIEFINMNHGGIVRSLIRKNKTFGSSKKLRKTIAKFFTQEDYQDLLKMNTEVIVTVSNLSLGSVEYKNSNDCAYEDFCDWVWASANFLPFMSLLKKNHMEYGDGGFGNNVPIQAAIDAGAKEIDVIVLEPQEKMSNSMPSSNAFDLTMKVFDFILDQNSASRLELSGLKAQNRNVKVQRYFTPRMLTENSLIFNKKRMSAWWEEGRTYAANVRPESKVIKKKTDDEE